MAADLFAGAALGLSVAAPFGPVSLICVQQSLNRGYRYGMVSGLGAATAHGIFATAAVVGSGSVSTAVMPWSAEIRLVSTLVLVGLGIRTILRARSVAKPVCAGTLRLAYASALMVSVSNPMTIIPYLALATAAAENIGSSALSFSSVIGAMSGTAAWYSCISFVTVTMRRGLNPKCVRILNLISGGSLIVFGAAIGRTLIFL